MSRHASMRTPAGGEVSDVRSAKFSNGVHCISTVEAKPIARSIERHRSERSRFGSGAQVGLQSPLRRPLCFLLWLLRSRLAHLGDIAHHGLVAYDQLFDGLGTPCTVQTWSGTPSGALPPN